MGWHFQWWQSSPYIARFSKVVVPDSMCTVGVAADAVMSVSMPPPLPGAPWHARWNQVIIDMVQPKGHIWYNMIWYVIYIYMWPWIHWAQDSVALTMIRQPVQARFSARAEHPLHSANIDVFHVYAYAPKTVLVKCRFLTFLIWGGFGGGGGCNNVLGVCL